MRITTVIDKLQEDEPAAYSLKVWDASLVEQDPMRSRLSLKRLVEVEFRKTWLVSI